LNMIEIDQVRLVRICEREKSAYPHPLLAW
jgi:hypothetical protein